MINELPTLSRHVSVSPCFTTLTSLTHSLTRDHPLFTPQTTTTTTPVVNCTFGKSGIPNFFEGRELGGKRMHYLVFPVGHWSLDVGPSDEELLEFVTPLFDFIELAWKKKVRMHPLPTASTTTITDSTNIHSPPTHHSLTMLTP